MDLAFPGNPFVDGDYTNSPTVVQKKHLGDANLSDSIHSKFGSGTGGVIGASSGEPSSIGLTRAPPRFVNEI